MLAVKTGGRVAVPLVTTSRGAARGFKILNPSADFLVFKGKKADHKPVSVELKAGEKYRWCACGLSPKQPFCDDTCKPDGLTMSRPVEFEVERTGTYMLCMCKQTEKRPLCDGSHKNVSKEPYIPAYKKAITSLQDDDEIYNGVARDLGFRKKGGFIMS